MALDRRTFLKDAGLLVAALGLGPALRPTFAEALEELTTGRAPVLWLQGQSCSGCSVSLLNSERPGPADLLTRYLSLYFHQTLSAATGEAARQALERAIEGGGYVLVTEGAAPLGVPEACTVGEEPYVHLLQRAARRASAVVAVGTCACFGGIPAAPPNLTGAASTTEALAAAGITVPVVHLPGCPPHPAWMVGNLVHLLRVGMPDLDEHRRPIRTYGRLLHDQCPHFADYERQDFAVALGQDGCLFKLGCQGVITHADCSQRGWNGGVNWCVSSRAPCVGCARPEFARDPTYPFYRLNEAASRT
ncbi:MAG: hydrogenase small subunit [Proteobacteria bacterium]|nr:hydrogenase small subunit [Pseudomonadota bacterium]